MVEFRSLDRHSPRGDDWVVIEKRDDRYFLTGRANGRSVEPRASPNGFGDPRDAMQAALWWAEYLEAPIIYLKMRRSGAEASFSSPTLLAA
jgi:hypothetical protein